MKASNEMNREIKSSAPKMAETEFIYSSAMSDFGLSVKRDTLESILINGVPDEATVCAKLVDGQFAAESEAIIVVGSEAPDGFESFGTGEEITEAMRESLWLDYDPDVDPEEYADFDMNYPANNSAFDDEFLAAAVTEAIRQRNEESVEGALS